MTDNKQVPLQEWQRDMTKAVGDNTVADIVQDFRRGVPEPSGLGGASKFAEPKKGNGWIEPRPLEAPAGVNWCDRMMDVQDRIDRAAREEAFARGGMADGSNKAGGK
jgi:hypothetical protein